MQKISEEQLKVWLSLFFKGGYSSTKGDNYVNDWYLGYFTMNGRIDIQTPLEINLDCNGTTIVFHWYGLNGDEFSEDEFRGYIRGIMSQIAPFLTYEDDASCGSTMLFSTNNE